MVLDMVIKKFLSIFHQFPPFYIHNMFPEIKSPFGTVGIIYLPSLELKKMKRQNIRQDE